MKKKFFILVVVTLLAALAVVPVLAKPTLVKGVITDITDNQVTLETKKNAEVIFTLPEDFDLTTLAVGDTVIAKCQTVGEELVAEWVKKVGRNSSDNEDKAEGRKDNSAWCNADKKQEAHPFATAMAEKFEADPAWVMKNFCDGYSMGAIMLALRTQAINGADPDKILALRAEGLGWGAIWKDLKMIGNEREAKTPPGLLKKP